jgi:hypothetical protein
MDDVRRDEVVQEAARELFLGVAPERRAELERLWKQYGPLFEFHTDNGPAGFFVLDAGQFRLIRFNHRAMRAFWLASFIAWEGFSAVRVVAETAKLDLDRFNSMIDSFQAMLAAGHVTSVPLPDGVPEPGIYPNGMLAPEPQAAVDLAKIAVGWSMLHEVRHIRHQQDGTSAPSDAAAKEVHDEELSCDAYATDFLLEGVTDYAKVEGVEPQRVHEKRQAGIYFALFTMALICAGRWGASQTHPALQERIDAAIEQMDPWRYQDADKIGVAAFEVLRRRWPSAPSLTRALDRWRPSA